MKARSIQLKSGLRFYTEWLFDITRALFAVALACESFFGATFLSGFEVERVAFDFFDNIFLLNFSLEPTERAFKRFTILQMDFCQLNSPPSTNAQASTD